MWSKLEEDAIEKLKRYEETNSHNALESFAKYLSFHVAVLKIALKVIVKCCNLIIC